MSFSASRTGARKALPFLLAATSLLALSSRAFAADMKKAPGQLSLGLMTVTAGEGFTEKQISTIESVLLTSFEATGRFKVVGRQDINALLGLEARKQAVGCSDDTACVAQIAGALGVDLVATADVGLLGTTTVITLTVIDVRTATVLRRLRRILHDPNDLVGAMDSIAAEVSSAVAERTDPNFRTPPPPPQAAPPPPVAPPPPAYVYGGATAVLQTPDGRPRLLHLQLGREYDGPWTMTVVTAQRNMACPIPLTRTQSCNLTPIDAGDARFTVMAGENVVKDGAFTIPIDGAQFKLVPVRPRWATGVGITAIVLGSISALVGIIAFAESTGDVSATSTGIGGSVLGAGLLGAGIALLAAVRSPELVPLESSDPLVPAQ